MRKIIPFLLLFWGINFLFANSYKFDEFTIHASQKDSLKVKTIMTRVLKKVEIFQKKVGVYPEFPVNVYVARNSDEYKSFTDNFTNEILEFSGAFYSSKDRSIYVRNLYALPATSDTADLILHEYIHVFVHHYFINAPLWFHEGMAVFFSSGISLERETRSVLDQFSDNPLTLIHMMRNYPKNKIEWEAYYGKSAIAVRFLFNNYKNGMLKLWSNEKVDKNFYREFQKAFYANQNQFSQRFENYMDAYSKRSLYILISSLIPIFIPIIFLINWLRRKIQYLRMVNTEIENEESTKEDNYN